MNVDTMGRLGSKKIDALCVAVNELLSMATTPSRLAVFYFLVIRLRSSFLRLTTNIRRMDLHFEDRGEDGDEFSLLDVLDFLQNINKGLIAVSNASWLSRKLLRKPIEEMEELIEDMRLSTDPEINSLVNDIAAAVRAGCK